MKNKPSFLEFRAACSTRQVSPGRGLARLLRFSAHTRARRTGHRTSRNNGKNAFGVFEPRVISTDRPAPRPLAAGTGAVGETAVGSGSGHPAQMDAYQHAARGLLADEVSSAAAIGLVNVSVEESFQVNEDAFHDRIIKVSESTPACPASSSAPGSADGIPSFPAAPFRHSTRLAITHRSHQLTVSNRSIKI